MIRYRFLLGSLLLHILILAIPFNAIKTDIPSPEPDTIQVVLISPEPKIEMTQEESMQEEIHEFMREVGAEDMILEEEEDAGDCNVPADLNKEK